VRRRSRIFKNIIAGTMALLGLGIVGAEIYRYVFSPFGSAGPGMQPFYVRAFKSDYCWFQLHYVQTSAGMTLCQPYNPFREDPSVLLGIDREYFTFEVWKRPIGVKFQMRPLFYPIVLLPYPLLVLTRFVRGRRTWLRFRRGLCQECGYDLTGNESGRCPECGAEAVANPESIPLTKQLRLLPWRRISLAVAALTISASTWYGVDWYLRTADLRINPDRDALAEFQRLLPMVASGRIENEDTLDEFLLMAAEHREIRVWLADAYAGLSPERQWTAMSCVLRTAKTQTHEEFVPLVLTAIENDQLTGGALAALRYYDVPDRREILERFVCGEPSSRRSLASIALRVHVMLHGVDGVEDALEGMLEGTHRDRIAGMIVANVEGPWRDRALRVMNEFLEHGDWSLDAFRALVRDRGCGDDVTMQHAQRILRARGLDDAKIVQDYVDMCTERGR
jgi:hypothetical protein